MSGLTEGRSEQPVSSVYTYVETVASGQLTPEEQWWQLERIGKAHYHECNDADPADIGTALIDFAANPASSSSVLVRAMALEKGMDTLRSAIQEDPYTRLRLRDDIGASYRELESEFPELLDKQLRDELTVSHWDDPHANRRNGAATTMPELYHETRLGAYRKAAFAIAETEGLETFGTLTPYWTEDIEYRLGLNYGNIPLMPFLIMEHCIGNDNPGQREREPLVNFIPPSLLRTALEAAITPRWASNENEGASILSFARLARCVREGGDEHTVPLEFLATLPTAQRLEYARTFNELYDTAEGLRAVFPPELGDAVVKGARERIANALFAVEAHVKGGMRTDVHLKLRGGSEIEQTYEGDEPIQLLQALGLVFRTLHDNVKRGAPMPAVEQDWFDIYRYIKLDKPEVPAVVLTMRPESGEHYSGRHEHGRPETGADATFDYLVCIDPEELPPLLVCLKPDAAVSVRTDLDQGRITFDVASIMGRSSRLGTKIGRFLAWGNHLRSQAIGEASDFNHVPLEGGAAQLATIIRNHKKQLAAEAVSWQDVRDWGQRFAGQLAVNAP